MFDLERDKAFCMHGCGAYHGILSGNSENALRYWKSKGFRMFEIDMSKTSDGRYVALAHKLDRRYLLLHEIFDNPEKRTEKWFLRKRLHQISLMGGQ